MPWGLRRYQDCGHLHFITFSCYRRRQYLDPSRRSQFEHALERARVNYGFFVVGYVVMPEHVHLLVSEPERDCLATAIKAMKLSVARRVGGRFWQERYYDFNVWSERKRIEKLRYIHRNPVRRGLVEKPEHWQWCSYRHYLTGERGIVEIESEWTARRRERMGITPQVRIRETHPGKPKAGLPGAPSGEKKE
jgi:putative transposase